MTTLYGIKNCDTVKKAKKWLEDNNVTYTFHDFRADGLTAMQIDEWLGAIDIDQLINKRSTTWKQLSEPQRKHIENHNLDVIRSILMEQPTLIKRPLLDTRNEYHVGFKVQDYTSIFS